MHKLKEKNIFFCFIKEILYTVLITKKNSNEESLFSLFGSLQILKFLWNKKNINIYYLFLLPVITHIYIKKILVWKKNFDFGDLATKQYL